MALNDQKYLYKLYTKYVYRYVIKNKKSDCTLLMEPGLFCEYFAIELYRKKRNIKDLDDNSNMENIYETIIDDLARPNCQFCKHPAAPLDYMDIYKDEDGDLPEICGWQDY
jgi:hypothetical protein